MTLEEYKSDQQSLLERLSQQDSERIRFVDTYLKVRKFTDDELLLLILMTEDQISAKAVKAYEEWESRGPEDDDFLPEDYRPAKKHMRDPWQDEIDLVDLLSKAMEVPPYPFEKISPRYLTDLDKSKQFKDAETFMIQFNYFEKDGSWSDTNDLTDLVSFLNLLRRADILNYSTHRNMDSYFSNRYKMETIGDLLKPSKFKTCKKFDQYRLLVSRLGLKMEDLIGS